MKTHYKPSFGTHAQDVLDRVQYKNWSFEVDIYKDWDSGCYAGNGLRVVLSSVQYGRWWRLSEYMTDSEIVQTALKAVLTAEEHEAREQFLYRGKAIFGPHLNVELLCGIAEDLDVRPSKGRRTEDEDSL